MQPLPNNPDTNAPGTTALGLDALFVNIPPGLSSGGVSDSLWRNTAGAGEEKPLSKRIPVQKMLEVQTPSPRKRPLPVIGISWLKHLQSKCPTTGPCEKHVINRNKEKWRWCSWCKFVSSFCFLSIYQCTFCLSIGVHFQSLNRQISFCLSMNVRFVNIWIDQSHFCLPIDVYFWTTSFV